MILAVIEAVKNSHVLGMPWPAAVLLLAAIMLVIDIFFFAGDALTYVAHLLVTIVILHWLPTNNFLWLTAAGIVIYGMILAAHLFLWKGFAERFLNRIIAPDKHLAPNAQLVGRQGTLRHEDDQWLIHIGEEWLRCNPSPLPQADSCNATVVKADADGNLTVSPTSDPATNS